MDNYSKGGMVSFAEMITTKGWINSNTGGGHKAALNKILGDLEDDTDVREIDVKTQVVRYSNLHPGELSPSSLKQYEKRVRAMIGYYTAWKKDPTNFKPPAREPSDKADKPAKASKATKPATKTVSQQLSVISNLNGEEKVGNAVGKVTGTLNGGTQVASLSMPFPMRDDYLAQITIPRDMTKDEAARLCTFIQALARA